MKNCSTTRPKYAKVKTTGEVFEIARCYFGTVVKPVISPASPGRVPMAKRHTDKGQFFQGDRQQGQPQGFEVYRGGQIMKAPSR